jgi:hypothetical protein
MYFSLFFSVHICQSSEMVEEGRCCGFSPWWVSDTGSGPIIKDRIQKQFPFTLDHGTIQNSKRSFKNVSDFYCYYFGGTCRGSNPGIMYISQVLPLSYTSSPYYFFLKDTYWIQLSVLTKIYLVKVCEVLPQNQQNQLNYFQPFPANSFYPFLFWLPQLLSAYAILPFIATHDWKP